MRTFKIQFISATSERWFIVHAINEAVARSMVFTNRRWQIGEIIPL